MSDENDLPVSFDVEGDLLTELSGGKVADPAASADPANDPAGDKTSPSLRSSLARGMVDPSVNDDPKVNPEDELLPDDPLYVAPKADDDDDDSGASPDPDPTPDAKGPVDVFAIAKAHGIDLTLKYGNDPAKALEGLVNAQKLIGQRDDLAAYGKRLIEDPKGVLAYLQSLYPADAAAKVDPAAAAKPKVGDAPEYDPAWADSIDAEGKLLPGADPAIPAKLAKYQQWLGNRARDFAADPAGKLLPLLQEQIREMAKKEAEALVAKTKQESEAERVAREQVELAHSLINEEASWAFEDGDRSKPMTPEGQIFHQFLIALETPNPVTGQIPVPDLRHRRDVAKLMTRDKLGQMQKKDSTIDRGAKQAKMAKRPNRASALDPSERPWPKGLSLEEALMRQLDKQK